MSVAHCAQFSQAPTSQGGSSSAGAANPSTTFSRRLGGVTSAGLVGNCPRKVGVTADSLAAGIKLMLVNIVQAQQSKAMTVGLHHRQHGNLRRAIFHQSQGVSQQSIRCDPDRVDGHHVGGR